jgi:hypothetical protein
VEAGTGVIDGPGVTGATRTGGGDPEGEVVGTGSGVGGGVVGIGGGTRIWAPFGAFGGGTSGEGVADGEADGDGEVAAAVALADGAEVGETCATWAASAALVPQPVFSSVRARAAGSPAPAYGESVVSAGAGANESSTKASATEAALARRTRLLTGLRAR